MTHVFLNWPPDRPEFSLQAGFKVPSRAFSKHQKSNGRPSDIAEVVGLSIALNYFSGKSRRDDADLKRAERVSKSNI